jgi:sec-independent protein translocase protein TatC
MNEISLNLMQVNLLFLKVRLEILDTSIFKQSALFSFLETVRNRFIKSGITLVITIIPCGIFWKHLFDFLMLYPLSLSDPKPQLIYTNPSETVVISFYIALFCGVIIASPVIFYQLWRIVSPSIIRIKKRAIFPIAFFSTFFFLAGCGFCYFILPVILKFLLTYAQNRIDPVFKIAEYFSFLIKLCISFGIVFELPVITYVLAKAGLINARFFLVNIRYAIVIIFILAAILTPPDVFSQLLLALPLLILYLISSMVAFFTYKKSQGV